MKTPKTKEELIDRVVDQIKLDVRCGDYSAIQELMKLCPVENLIAFLPEVDWRHFTHLVTEEYLKKEKDESAS